MHCNKYCENIYCNYRYERMDNKSSPGGRTVKWPKTPSPMEGGVTIESMEKIMLAARGNPGGIFPGGMRGKGKF